MLLVFGLLALVQAARRVQEVDADFLELVKAKDLIAKGVEKRGELSPCYTIRFLYFVLAFYPNLNATQMQRK